MCPSKTDLESIVPLVVDPEGSLKKIFENSGDDSFNAIVVENGEEALDLISDRKISCVIHNSDACPEQSLDFLEKVKSRYQEIPFIMFASKGNEELAKDAISLDVDEYLMTKDYKMLKQRVMSVMEAKKYKESAHLLLQRMDDSFLSMDKKGIITFVNEEATKVLGYSEEELIGNNFWEVFEEAKDTRFEIEYKKALEENKSVYFEEYYPPLDTWFAVKAYPSVDGLSVYFSDVSDRKQWQKQMRDRLEQQEIITNLLRRALEENDVVELQQKAVEQVTKNIGADFGKILEFDRSRNKMVLAASYGIDTGEIGKPIMDIDNAYQASRSFQSKEPIVIEDFNESDFQRSDLIKFMGARSGISVIVGGYDSPWGTLNIYSKKVKNYSISQVKFVQAVANIIATALEKSDRDLKASEYRDALDSLNQGVYILDGEDRFLTGNSCFEKMSGYRIDELKGKEHSILEIEHKSNGKNLISKIQTHNGKVIEVDVEKIPVVLSTGAKGTMVVLEQK